MAAPDNAPCKSGTTFSTWLVRQRERAILDGLPELRLEREPFAALK
jgi:hypothetical protein